MMVGVLHYDAGLGAPDSPVVVCSHGMQAALGIAWGMYVWELGRALRSRFIVNSGQVILVLLSTGSAVTAAAMLGAKGGGVDLAEAAAILTAAGSVLLCVTAVKLVQVVRAPQALPVRFD
jgi:hypothetical protein